MRIAHPGPLSAAALLCTIVTVGGGAPAEARLPEGVKPSRYAIRMAIDLDAGTFSGSETIEVDVAKATSKVTLHSVGLEISEARAGATGSPGSPGSGDAPLATVGPTPGDQQGETITVTTSKPLAAGKARLAFTFRGKLDPRLRGLYSAKLDGKRYALTQFEGTDARRAFPCFDEPAHKARFQLTLTVAHGLAAISNTPITGRVTSADGKSDTVTFAETLPMSSYLVAIAVGPFASKSTTVIGTGGKAGDGSRKTPITVWMAPGSEALADYALKEAAAVLPKLEAWFGIPYPYGKLDLIAAPEFQFGGMENVACILFKMSALLVDEKSGSPESKRRVAEVIAHEVAHQWFGDLVTMSWWDDIWLNESFATWMEKKVMDDLHPDWHIWRDFTVERDHTLSTDELAHTHPIHALMFTDGASAPGAPGTPQADSEDDESSPTIIYGKGSATLRMIERWLGEDRFRKGVNAYLAQHQFGNTRGADFFAALGAATGEPVGGMAEQWIGQAGHPLVSVGAECVANGKSKSTRLTFEQQRLYGDGRGNAETLWQVPVCTRYATSADDTKGREICVMLKDRRQSVDLELNGGGCLPWVVANSGAGGFFRVRYDAGLLASLLKRTDKLLSVEERVALLTDQWALVAAGRAPVSDWFAVLAAIHRDGGDKDRAVLEAVAIGLRAMDRHLLTDKERPALGRLVESLFGPRLVEVGMSAPAGKPNAGIEEEDTQRLRALAIGELGLRAHRPDLVARAKDTLTASLKTNTPIDGALADAWIRIAAAHGDAALFDAYVARAKADRSPEEREHFLSGLGAFEKPELITRSLEMVTGSVLRTEELERPIRLALESRAGAAQGLRFLGEHLAELQKRAAPWNLVRLSYAAGGLCSEAEAKQVTDIFTAHPLDHGKLALAMALDGIAVCTARRAQTQGKLAALLAAAVPKSAK